MRLHASGAVAARIMDVLRHLAEDELPLHWARLLAAPPERRASTAAVFVWLLEEWWLGARLTGAALELQLSLPLETAASELETIFPSTRDAPPASRPSVRLKLRRG
jgi:hypothetical protein